MTLYEALGGDSVIHALVADFYARMDHDPAYAGLRAVHPADLGNARERLYKYLTGWTGGPPLFVTEFGHPMLRARHLHVHIDSTGRDQWLHCMQAAIQACVPDAALGGRLLEALAPLADHMRNAG